MEHRNKKSNDWRTRALDAASLETLREHLPPTELWSLLLDVAEHRASQRTPADVRRQWEFDRFVAPAYLDQRTQIEFDRVLYQVAERFESVELSPLAPFGSCSAVAATGQNRIVSTMRGTEVVSDPTNVLALESARRLRNDATQTVRLSTSHRCVRAQALPNRPGMAAHFRLFCLTTTGHETKNHELVTTSLIEHIRFHLDAFARLESIGYRFPEPRLKILSTPTREHLAQRIVKALPNIPIDIQPLVQQYYDGLRFTLSAQSPGEGEIMLSDGGAFDWLATLNANRKLVFVASAMGSQRAAALFKY